MKIYNHLRKAFDRKETIPQLVTILSKNKNDIPEVSEWANDFEDTVVHIKRIVSYWLSKKIKVVALYCSFLDLFELCSKVFPLWRYDVNDFSHCWLFSTFLHFSS